MKNLEIITTDLKGYTAYCEEFYKNLYKKKARRILSREELEKRVNLKIHNSYNRYNITCFDYEDILTRNRVINILKKANAKIEIKITQAIGL